MAAVNLAYSVYDCDDADPNVCPIILTHGLFWNRFMYKDLAEKLSEAMKCRVYTLDLRNHGDSPAPPGLTIELIAEDVKKFIEDKGLERVHFVCHSFSSTVANCVHVDKPHIVQKMVLIDCPPFYTYDNIYTTELVASQVASQHRMLKALNPKMSLAQAKSRFYSLATKSDKSLEYFYKKAAYDLIKVDGQFKWKIDLDYILQRYSERHLITQPTSSNHEMLFLRCVHSKRLFDEIFDGILKLNPRAKLVTFEDTTHLLMFERQETFVEVVKEFLTSPSDGIETRRIV